MILKVGGTAKMETASYVEEKTRGKMQGQKVGWHIEQSTGPVGLEFRIDGQVGEEIARLGC